MNRTRRFRAGGWLLHDSRHLDIWVRDLKQRVAKGPPRDLVPPIQEFKEMVEQDPALRLAAWAMFEEAALLKHHTPVGSPEVRDFHEFLQLLNFLMTQAPEYTECPDSTGELEPCGLIGFPINALLDWPMATAAGYSLLSNALVNQQFKKILGYWSEYLVSDDSRSVLIEDDLDRIPSVLPWLGPTARQEMVNVACQAGGDTEKPFEHFFECDPNDKYYGFKSWDDFFIRRFSPGVRPVDDDDDVIVNACESAPLRLVPDPTRPDDPGVSYTAKFWLKGQPYSLQNMMDFDPLAEQFVGGTVYQAFLSALSYHRWQSPVTGTVKRAFVVNGSYFLENRYMGFAGPDPDAAAPNDSQPFLTGVATRAVIFIEADNPKIGLMCFLAMGMADVSSCEITVAAGDRVYKGDDLGTYHFGGSTHCLVFRPGVKLHFDFHNTRPGMHSTNIPVNSRIATVLT